MSTRCSTRHVLLLHCLLLLGLTNILLPCQAAYPSYLADYPIAGHPSSTSTSTAVQTFSFIFYPRSANGIAPASLTAPYPAAIEALLTNATAQLWSQVRHCT